MYKSFSCKLILILLLVFGSARAQSQSSISLEPLGQVTIPHNYMFEKTPVGGLSGITFDPGSGRYYVISDDRSDRAKARFYSITVELNAEKRLEAGGVQFQSMYYLRMPDGAVYPKGEIDPEDIALAVDSLLYVSSEGVPDKRIAPFINAHKKDGSLVKELTIPAAYWSQQNSRSRKHGVRNNLGFEGLTASPDGTRLYAATENALLQDGHAADADNESPSRLIVYDLVTGNILHEYIYMVERVRYDDSLLDMFSVNGLTAMLALDGKGNLLALERNFVAGQGNKIALYAINTEEATDIKGVTGLQELTDPPKPVEKHWVANLNDYNITIDNFEGLALGPELEGGGRLLLMVSDNNFSRSQQTLFTAFRLLN